MPYVASRSALQRLELRAPQALSRLDSLAAEASEPSAPVGPPASGFLRCAGQPVVSIRAQAGAGPLARLVSRGRMDDPGDVPAGAEHEGRLAVDQLGTAVSRAPGNDMVFARGEYVRRNVDLPEVHRHPQH